MAPLSLSFCSETSPAFLPLQVLDLKAIQIDGTKACYTPSTFSESVFPFTTVTTIWTSLDISDSFLRRAKSKATRMRSPFFHPGPPGRFTEEPLPPFTAAEASLPSCHRLSLGVRDSVMSCCHRFSMLFLSQSLSSRLSPRTLQWRSPPTSSPQRCRAAAQHPFDAVEHLPAETDPNHRNHGMDFDQACKYI